MWSVFGCEDCVRLCVECVCDCEAWVRSLCVYEGVWGVCEGVCVECVCVCVWSGSV